MKYYVELTLLPDVDISLYFLWGKVYQQIHLALVEQQDSDKRIGIGASFPEYQFDEKHKTLGNKLRLFADSEDALSSLDLSRWLSRLNDYVHRKSITTVPEKLNGYAYFKRVQTKSNLQRISRRSAKHLGISEEEMLARFQDRKEVASQAPFIRLESLSSENGFRLMVSKQPSELPSYSKGFSTYGLSSKENPSTVPIF